MSDAGIWSIAISALAIALSIWSDARRRQYEKWNKGA